MTKADLQARWDGEQGQRRAQAVYEALTRGATLDAIAFGEVGERYDLRGLHFGDRDLSWGLRVVGQSLVGLDLRWTQAIFAFEDCEIRNVCLDGAALGDTWPGMHIQRTLFSDCSFRSADIGHAYLDVHMSGSTRARPKAPLHAPSVYRNCDFTRTRFRRYSSLGFAVFEDCMFDSTRLPGYDALDGPSLYRCTFKGKFGSHYLGFRAAPTRGEDLPRIVDVDFAAAQFEELTACHFTSEPGPPPQPRPRPRWFGLRE